MKIGIYFQFKRLSGSKNSPNNSYNINNLNKHNEQQIHFPEFSRPTSADAASPPNTIRFTKFLVTKRVSQPLLEMNSDLHSGSFCFKKFQTDF
jgi:hypothetical protein